MWIHRNQPQLFSRFTCPNTVPKLWLRKSTTFKWKIQYLSNCIISIKFYYQYNAYITTNMIINSVHPDQQRFVTNKISTKKKFTINTTSNILKNLLPPDVTTSPNVLAGWLRPYTSCSVVGVLCVSAKYWFIWNLVLLTSSSTSTGICFFFVVLQPQVAVVYSTYTLDFLHAT